MTAADKIAEARALIEPLTGYTPGPWDASGLTVYDTCMEGVASCHAGADARLIAASPALRDTVAAMADLAEAQAQEIAKLQGALREVRQCTSEHYGAARALKIIAAALGETP